MTSRVYNKLVQHRIDRIESLIKDIEEEEYNIRMGGAFTRWLMRRKLKRYDEKKLELRAQLYEIECGSDGECG